MVAKRRSETHSFFMSFGPNAPKVGRTCPSCHLAVPVASLSRCPACKAELSKPGNPGEALIEAMTDVLHDPLGKKRGDRS